MTIKQNGGVFGRNPTFNDVTIEGQLTFDGDIDINSDLKVNGDLDVVGGMTVDADTLVVDAVNNRVGINTPTNPLTALMIEHNNNGADGGTIRIKDRDSQQSADQLTGAIEFESEDATIPTSGVSSAIQSFAASSTGGSYLKFSTTAIATSTLTEAARFTPIGNLAFPSGQGIDFSATAGTGTSELLDDYEEGTWTPVIYGSSSAGTATYSNQTGNYTKVGNLVCAVGRVSYSGHTGTGSMQMSGLPFTATGTNLMEPPIIVFGSDISLTANNYLVGTVKRSDTYVEFLQTPVGGGTISTVTVDTGGSLFFTITYQAS